MSISIRSARREDQQTIVSFIRQAKINLRDLPWDNFLVGRLITSLISIFGKDKVRIAPMKRE